MSHDFATFDNFMVNSISISKECAGMLLEEWNKSDKTQKLRGEVVVGRAAKRVSVKMCATLIGHILCATADLKTKIHIQHLSDEDDWTIYVTMTDKVEDLMEYDSDNSSVSSDDTVSDTVSEPEDNPT